MSLLATQFRLTVSPFESHLENFANVAKLSLRTLQARIGDKHLSAGSLSELRSQIAHEIYLHFHVQNPFLADTPTTGYQDYAQNFIDEIRQPIIWQQVDKSIKGKPKTVNGQTHATVQLGGVKVLAPWDDVAVQDPGELATLRMPSWRARTTPGYLLVIGGKSIQNIRDVTRFYIACDFAGQALSRWGQLQDMLETHASGFHIKALSSSAAYPRSDSIVVYVPNMDRSTVEKELQSMSWGNTPAGCRTSIFSRSISPGITTAAEPADTRAEYARLSFGQHRSRILADSLIYSHDQRISLKDAWSSQTALAGINSEYPAENYV